MENLSILWVVIIALMAVLTGLGLGWFLRRFAAPSAPQLEDKISEISNQQVELKGSLTSFVEMQTTASGELNRTLNERLDKVSQSVAENLKETGEKTTKTLSDLGARLSLIDEAQKQITALSGQVVELQQILDNKQARGAFGEVQLADIVTDLLPESAYALQHTLSNHKRADCLIRLPNPPGPVVVDSKFPLEAYQSLRKAEDEGEVKAALRRMTADILTHAQTIAEKYIIHGETADAALMFLPSETVFSELHLRLPEVVEKCRAMHVYPVSPNTMALVLNTVRAIMRDVKMREQAGLIQKEVGLLLGDVNRLNERVGKLGKSFDSAHGMIREISISSDKITSRGEKITTLELKQDQQDEEQDLLEG